MFLHPDVALARFRDEHEDVLVVLSGCLDQAAAESFLRWEDRDSDLPDMDSSVLAGSVRQSLADLLLQHLPRQRGVVDRTLNCGVHLYLRPGRRTRVRKRPLSAKTLAPVQVAPIPEPLFGAPFPPYEVAVLWTLDMKQRCLGSAALAAATSLDEPHLAALYGELPLPVGQLPFVHQFPPTAAQPVDDFDDFLDRGAAAQPSSA